MTRMCPICIVEGGVEQDFLDGHLLLESHFTCHSCNGYSEHFITGNTEITVGLQTFRHGYKETREWCNSPFGTEKSFFTEDVRALQKSGKLHATNAKSLSATFQWTLLHCVLILKKRVGYANASHSSVITAVHAGIQNDRSNPNNPADAVSNIETWR